MIYLFLKVKKINKALKYKSSSEFPTEILIIYVLFQIGFF